MTKKYKLAVLVSHPILYQSSFFKKLDQQPKIDLMVYFCGDFNIEKDNYALKGYKYKFLKNFSPHPHNSFFGQMNLGIIKELFSERYDAVLVHGYARFTCWLAFLGAFITRTPILLKGVTTITQRRSIWAELSGKLILFPLFKIFSAFLTVGTMNKSYYKSYGVPDSKMFFVPYSVDNDFFSKKYKKLSLKKKQLKKEEGLNPNLPIILHVSNLLSIKRPLDLLKAFQPLQNKAQLVFVGEGTERKKIELYVKEHNLKNIFFVGFKNRQELPIYYVIADIFVLPSASETWGAVINEAMNFKLPIITTDNVGSAPDLIKNGENGYIYKVGDITALSKHLLRLLKNPKLIKKMGEKSYEIIYKWNFDKDVEGIIKAMDYIL
ncbi:MAG: glycosyltransferase family 4 protein [Candidatus Aenigmarchaeota archaeon]|nr:glycosyltransferase family 4 protein [Candidatus Aenigmarchaeota archaeon]